MNRSAAGLSVKIANGQGRTGSSIGNIFTSDWEATDFGRAPPPASAPIVRRSPKALISVAATAGRRAIR